MVGLRRRRNDWYPDLVQHGDVEANPGPRRAAGSRNRGTMIASINLGGEAAVQTSVSCRRRHRLATVAKRIGYHTYAADPTQGVSRRIGGLITLVSSALPSSQAEPAASSRGGQSLAVQVAGTLFMNIYMGHGERKGDAEQAAVECIASRPLEARWMVAGDFNAVPNESATALALIQRGGEVFASDIPTRWNGRQVIDYAVANFEATSIDPGEEKFSDHRMVRWARWQDGQWNFGLPAAVAGHDCGRMGPQP